MGASEDALGKLLVALAAVWEPFRASLHALFEDLGARSTRRKPFGTDVAIQQKHMKTAGFLTILTCCRYLCRFMIHLECLVALLWPIRGMLEDIASHLRVSCAILVAILDHHGRRVALVAPWKISASWPGGTILGAQNGSHILSEVCTTEGGEYIARRQDNMKRTNSCCLLYTLTSNT